MTEPDVEPPIVAQRVGKEEPKEPETQRQLIAKRFKKIIIKMPLTTKTGEASENPDNHDDAKEGNINPKKQNILDSIKIPLISVLPRKFTKETKEQVNMCN